MRHGRAIFTLTSTFFFTIFFTEISFALYVGVAPGHLDLGVVKAGESRRLTFYILSDTTEELSIKLEYREMNPFLIRDVPWSLEELSEESFRDWISFMDGNPVKITSAKTFYPEIGLSVNKKYNAILTIPRDAEPGYHTAAIALLPQVPPPAERGARVTIITTAQLRVTFRVEGKVERNLQVLGFLEKMEMPRSLLVTTFVRNSGNVTLTSELTSLNIFDENGSVIVSASGTKGMVTPGKIETFVSRINTLNLEEGKRYNASVTVRHATGEITYYGTILIPKYVEVIMPPLPKPPFPWWIVAVLILICAIGYLIYRLAR